MKINLSTNYGIRAVIYLAAEKKEHNSTEIATAVGVPPSVMRRVLQKLKSADIIKADRGIDGGYAFVRQPEEVSLLDIMSVMQETDILKNLIGHDLPPCPAEELFHKKRAYLVDLQNEILQSLHEMTLDKLLES